MGEEAVALNVTKTGMVYASEYGVKIHVEDYQGIRLAQKIIAHGLRFPGLSRSPLDAHRLRRRYPRLRQLESEVSAELGVPACDHALEWACLRAEYGSGPIDVGNKDERLIDIMGRL